MKELEQLKVESTCFGSAYDGEIKECKLCICNGECKALMTGKPYKPESPMKDKISKELSNRTRGDKVTPSIQYPDFKAMTMEALEKLAIERNADPSWQKYNNQGIRRMRLTMALKKTYAAESEAEGE